MKNILKKIWFEIATLIAGAWIYIVMGIVGTVVGLIYNSVEIGVYTFFGLGLTLFLYISLRQLWWWITSTGDFKKPEKK